VMKTLCTTVRSWDSDWWKTQARFSKPRSERVRCARSQNKTSRNASITNRGMFFV